MGARITAATAGIHLAGVFRKAAGAGVRVGMGGKNANLPACFSLTGRTGRGVFLVHIGDQLFEPLAARFTDIFVNRHTIPF